MGLFHFLQTLPPALETLANPDSAKAVVTHLAQEVADHPKELLLQLGRGALQFGLKVLAALLIYIVGSWLIRRLKKLLRRLFERRKTDKALASFVTSMTSVMLTILLVVITVGTLGVNTSSLAALLAAGGVAVGMALSGALQNFAGGIMLLAFKPFKVGDFIEAQGYTGTVTDLTIVNTRLTTPDNRAIIIPNGALSGGNINNFSKHPIRRVEWNISLEYGTDAAACREKLLELLRSDARVLDTQTPGAADPTAVLSQLADSAIVFTVRAWVNVPDYWGLFFDYNTLVYTELPKAGFKFPFPQMDVHITQ